MPTSWSAEENVAWKTKLPVGGHASPVVWQDRVYVVGADEAATARVLVCLDRRSGKILWSKPVLESPLEKKHRLNSWASSTPATDGERIYISFLDQKSMFVAAYTMDGDEIWSVRPGVFSSVHGYCSCPVIYKDKLIVNGDHDGASYLIALDRRTGETLWKTPREFKTRSYCTPIIRTLAGRTQLMLSGSKSVASYNPDTGEQYWLLNGPTEQFVASLVENKGLVFVTGGFPEHHMLAIDPSGSGNISQSDLVKWHHRQKGDNYVPSPIAAGDHFLVAGDGGVCFCFDAKTGEIQWRERLGRHYSASLVSAGGLVYFTDDDGITKVVRPGPKLDVVSENKLGEATYASPAISQGRIYLRGENHLYAIGATEVAQANAKDGATKDSATKAEKDPAGKEKAQGDALPKPDKDGWISLFDGKSLRGWSPTKFGGEGDALVQDGAIVLTQGNDMTGVTITYKEIPTSNYEVSWEARRVQGNDFFCGLTFPVKKDPCSLILGGWGGGVCGLSSIDGQDASENSTSSGRDFDKGKWYAVRLVVTDDKIEAYLDKEKFIDQELEGRRISIRSEVDLSRPLGFSTWRTTGELRNIKLRKIEKAKK